MRHWNAIAAAQICSHILKRDPEKAGKDAS